MCSSEPEREWWEGIASKLTFATFENSTSPTLASSALTLNEATSSLANA